MVASVPELLKRTRSAPKRALISSASAMPSSTGNV